MRSLGGIFPGLPLSVEKLGFLGNSGTGHLP
jgi:hypothetical protein